MLRLRLLHDFPIFLNLFLICKLIGMHSLNSVKNQLIELLSWHFHFGGVVLLDLIPISLHKLLCIEGVKCSLRVQWRIVDRSFATSEAQSSLLFVFELRLIAQRLLPSFPNLIHGLIVNVFVGDHESCDRPIVFVEPHEVSFLMTMLALMLLLCFLERDQVLYAWFQILVHFLSKILLTLLNFSPIIFLILIRDLFHFKITLASFLVCIFENQRLRLHFVRGKTSSSILQFLLLLIQIGDSNCFPSICNSFGAHLLRGRIRILRVSRDRVVRLRAHRFLWGDCHHFAMRFVQLFLILIYQLLQSRLLVHQLPECILACLEVHRFLYVDNRFLILVVLNVHVAHAVLRSYQFRLAPNHLVFIAYDCIWTQLV